jgi:hypothetical protein
MAAYVVNTSYTDGVRVFRKRLKGVTRDTQKKNSLNLALCPRDFGVIVRFLETNRNFGLPRAGGHKDTKSKNFVV